jgi:uncharacterized protein (DUF1810 family)
MAFDLDRFRRAQDSGDFGAALDELRSGRKRGHWIWYVFPQLKGLGRSGMAMHFGLDGSAEAAAYLDDPDLRMRLIQAARVVRAQVCERGTRLDTLMGSQIDVLKLVSSMTLFERVARARTASEPDPALTELAGLAAEILAAAAAQGYSPCAFTLARV